MMRWRDRASAHDLSVVIEWVVLFLALQHTYFTLNETGILLQYMLELPGPNTERGGLQFPHVQWTAHAANMP